MDPDPSSSPVPPPAPRVGALGAGLRVAVFLAAFLATGALFRAVAAPGGGGLVGSKLQHFEAEPGRYDTVFLGSSHVFRSFVPEEFDRQLGARGVSASSFNLGVQMPSLLESHYLLRRVLAAGEGRIRRVFVEYLPLTPQIDPAQAFIPRVVYWHDGPETAVASQRVLALSAEGLEIAPLPDPAARWSLPARTEQLLVPGPWQVVLDHVRHFLARQLVAGRVKDVGRGVLGIAHGQTASMRATRGYVSLEEEAERLARVGRDDARTNPFLRRREAFLADLEGYRRLLALLDEEPSVFGDVEWFNEDLLRVHDLELIERLAADCEAHGAELVLVLMPGLSCEREVEERLLAQSRFAVLRYNVPAEHPELFEVENRFDSGHPSAEGALRFTQLLAGDYLGLTTP